MHITKRDIEEMDRVSRLKLVNSLSGIKPANLIGTMSENEIPNLAIFSSVFHLGSNPALLGFITRPARQVRRHTFENILRTRIYTINHVPASLAERAHYTSAKFEKDESEFEKCGIEEEYLDGFAAPFVKLSRLKLGMELVDTIPIKANDTTLVIGEIAHLIAPEEILSSPDEIDLEIIENIGISGLNSYYRVEKFAYFPFARPDELPETIAGTTE